MAFSAKYAFAIVAVFFTQGLCASRIRRSTDESTPLEELMNNAKSQLQTMTEEWNRVASSANLDEMKTMLETKTRELQTRTQNVMDELKRQYEVHGAEMSEKASAALAEATNTLNATIEHLKAQAPGMIEGAENLNRQFTDAIQSTAEKIFEETAKLANAAGDDSMHAQFTTISRDALSQTMDFMNQFQRKFKEVAEHATS